MTTKARVSVVVGSLLAAVVVAVLWVLAYNLQDDKSRAALIGAASALTAAMAAFGAGWVNAARSSAPQQAREDRAARQLKYAEVTLAGSAYDIHRKSAHTWFLASKDSQYGEQACIENAQRCLQADTQAQESRVALVAAIRDAALLAPDRVHAALMDFLRVVEVGSKPSTKVLELPWEALETSIKAERDQHT